MVDLKQRIIDLANRLATREKNARFLASAKPERFGPDYEPLLVRTSDKGDSLRMLTAAESAVTDVALILDVVLSQWQLLAAQAAEIDRLRADVEALRTEKLSTDVMKQVNDALLAAAQKGVELDGFAFTIETADSLSEEHLRRLASGESGSDVGSNERSGSLELGAVFDALKGARLAGEGAEKTIETVRSRLAERTQTSRSAARRASGSLKVDRVRRERSRNEGDGSV